MAGKMKDQTYKPKHNRTLVYAAVAIALILIPTVYFYAATTQSPSSPRAAIVDQLSSSILGALIRDQNTTFIQNAESLLKERFSTVDYYSDNATVEQYSHLASRDYKLIIWRGHSALDPSGYVALASTDKYGLKDYDSYLENDRLALCNITGDASLYFGATPKFIEQVMGGKFTDAVIFLMSCNGLNPGYIKTAQAFQSKGATAVISWDNWISSNDNDGAANALLEYLIDQNNTIGEAISKMPLYSPEYGGAQLRYYPEKPDAADYRIPDYKLQGVTAAAIFTVVARVQARTKNVCLVLETGRAWINQSFETP
jgi:hypothetical protein